MTKYLIEGQRAIRRGILDTDWQVERHEIFADSDEEAKETMNTTYSFVVNKRLYKMIAVGA